MLVTGIGSFIATGVFDFAAPVAYPPITLPLITAGALALTVREKQPAARVAARALGIFGGLIGGFGVFVAIVAIPEGLVIWGFLCSLIAIAGGVIALNRPALAGTLMLLSAVGGIGAVVMIFVLGTVPLCWADPGAAFIILYPFAALFLIPGGILALTSCKERPASINAAMILGIVGGLFAAVSALGVSPPFMLQEREAWEILMWEILVPIWVLLFPVMGFTAGILALVRPKVAGILMLISGISGCVGFFALDLHPYNHLKQVLCVLGGLLLVIGGVVALAWRKERPGEGVPV
jgi:hypothetical protein